MMFTIFHIDCRLRCSREDSHKPKPRLIKMKQLSS